MTIDLDKLEQLARAATPGPWEHDDDKLWASVTLHGFEIITSRMADRAKATADAAFIAAANPAAVLELAQRLRSAETIVRDLAALPEFPAIHKLCRASVNGEPAQHDESCLWRRAVEATKP